MIVAVLATACAAGGATGSADRLGTPASGALVTPGFSSFTPSGPGQAAPTLGQEGAVGRVVLRAYQAWWNAKIDAFGRSDSDGSQLGVLSTGQALSDSLASLHDLHDAKLVMSGVPRLAPVVTQLDVNAKPATATVEDCLDVSGWHQADATTGAVKDPQQRLSRYPASTNLRKYGDSWMVVEVTREVGRTC